MPLPTPVPKVIMIKSFIPLAAPYIISPTAAALASLVNFTGSLNLSCTIFAKGMTPFQGRFGAYSIVPVYILPLGAPMPMPLILPTPPTFSINSLNLS